MRRNCKNNVYVCLILAVLSVFISCESQLQDPVLPASRPVEVGIYAGGTQTRTQMLPNGLSTVWTSDDVISLFAKNSSGSFVLNNQLFQPYGLDGERGYFTSTLSSPMAQGTYTYYCCYPAPKSLAGSTGLRATFNLPNVQNGKASGGIDIMVADPVTGPELNPVNLEDVPHNDVTMDMNRLTHHFRFWIPPGENTLGEPIKKIVITMPNKVAGDYVTNLDSTPGMYKTDDDINAKWYHDLSNGTNTITLELEDPLDESPYSDPQFAYAVMFPLTHQMYSDDYMDITVYSNSSMAYTDRIALGGRRYLPGHSTIVRLLPNSPSLYSSIKIRTGRNNVGERLWSIKIMSDGTQLFRYDNSAGTIHNITYTKEYFGSSGKSDFDKVINAIKNGTAVLNYETQSTSIDIPITMDMMTLSGNSAELDFGDVPYLLFEDFDDVEEYAKSDEYDASFSDNDSDLTGYLLDGRLSSNGWNAARFKLGMDRVRINCIYEGAVFAYRKYCGRLDTPALKWIKPGATPSVVIEYDRAFSVPAGYNVDTSVPMARYYLGHHTNSEGSTINGIDIYDNDNAIRNNATIVYDGKVNGVTERFADEDLANMTHVTRVVSGVTNSTRFVFYVATDETKINFLGMNACYYLNLDNIKVYIKE